MKQLDLITNKELRENMVERVEVLEQVKEILTLGTTEFVTVEMAANYYEVDKTVVEKVIQRNKEELNMDGFRVYKSKELKEMLETVENTKNGQNVHFKIPPRGLRLIPKRALLRIGMLLRDSEVAKEVRTRLLDIVHDAEVKTDVVENVVEEIRTEQKISEDMLQAILDGDSNKLSVLQTELIGLKNKRIAKLEDTVVSSVTIQESRSIINMCVRKMAAYKYNSMFGKAWGDFYKFVNYKLGINVKARKGKGLDRFTDEEIKEIEVLAKCWVEAWEMEVGFKL